jgi:glycosyltransferase involved in cell wall biosynthesis
MKIVWFSWKDINHPLAGGAENVSWQIMRRLTGEGHEVKLITSRYPGSKPKEVNEGVEIFHDGNRFSVYLKARTLFKRQLADWPDLVIDEMNTVPFASGFYSRSRSLLLAYQLARKVWFYQMVFPLSVIGYLMEPIYLFGLSRKYKLVLTESDSTRQDMSRFGFSRRNVKVFRVGIDLKPVANLPAKSDLNHVLVLGSVRPMKRTLSALKAFELARSTNPALKLTIAGDNRGRYARKVTGYAAKSKHRQAINIAGRVSQQERLELMRQASVILVTSTKEGWGLIVTEANSQGTPAIAYDVDGLRDSIKDRVTGLLVKSGDEQALGAAITDLLSDAARYQQLRESAWQDSRQYTHENSYADFTKAAGIN